jgi:hypothetical protein
MYPTIAQSHSREMGLEAAQRLDGTLAAPPTKLPRDGRDRYQLENPESRRSSGPVCPNQSLLNGIGFGSPNQTKPNQRQERHTTYRTSSTHSNSILHQVRVRREPGKPRIEPVRRVFPANCPTRLVGVRRKTKSHLVPCMIDEAAGVTTV